MAVTQLSKTLQITALMVLVTLVLYIGKSVLVPLTFGFVIAMLLIPLSRWLERYKINRGIASVLSLLFFIAVVAAIIALIRWRISYLITDVDKTQDQLQELINRLQDFASQKLGFSIKQQQKLIGDNGSAGVKQVASFVAATLMSLGGFLVSTILALIYTFLFIYFRSHFKNFVLKLVHGHNKTIANHIMEGCSKVTKEYITGLGIMIVMLWVMYAIGFSIVGIKGAIFFAILCGTLEIIPFAGNVTGTTITVLVAAAQSGSMAVVLGVLLTYGLVQFIQSYILQPLIVGKQIDIHPLFTIFIIVVGEAVWGIPGMVLSLPLLGMLKVVFDNIESLKPYGYLIGSKRTRCISLKFPLKQLLI